jgi:DNA ligase 1
MKNPDGALPKTGGASKKTSGRKPTSKARKGGGDDDNDNEEEEDEVSTSKDVPELLLANKWDIETGPDPTGWWISEKLDGVRFVLKSNSTFFANTKKGLITTASK